MSIEDAALAQRDKAHELASMFEASCGAYITFPVGFARDVRVYATSQVPDGRRVFAVASGDRVTFAVLESVDGVPVDTSGFADDPDLDAAVHRIRSASPSLREVQASYDAACDYAVELRAA